MRSRFALRRVAAIVGAAAVIVCAASPPARAASAPELRSATFSRAAVAGRVATLELRAVDAERPVAGAVVAFEGEGAYGTSACRPGARPGETVAISVPHRFATAGPRPMVVRVETGGCTGGGGATIQSFTATPVEPGQQPVAPTLLGPAASILVAAPGVPTPGAPAPGAPAPALPVVPALPIVPELPGAPVVAPPELPPVPVDPVLPLPRARGAAACRSANAMPRRRNTRAIARSTLCLVNAERSARRLRALRPDRRLARAARAHARDMVARRYFAHVAPTAGDLTARLRSAAWLPRPPGWSAGENIGFGETTLSTPAATVRGWMGTTGHRANNLDPRWRLAGIAAVPGTPAAGLPGATYVAVFGR